MMKLAWLTDIHLNFLDNAERSHFYLTLLENNPDALLISGDIAEAPSLISILKEMAAQLKRPIYFVLGNHDYYHGEINKVRKAIASLTTTEQWLHWLPAIGSQLLAPDTILVGEDGWADARYGDYDHSDVVLNDSRLIANLYRESLQGKKQLREAMQQLADADAKQLYTNLVKTIRENDPKKVIVLTHVPPFKEACFYKGKISDDNYLPFFSSKATGKVLIEIAEKHPAIEFLVLCGHTHGEGDYSPLPNLIVMTGNVEYSHPQIQKVINI